MVVRRRNGKNGKAGGAASAVMGTQGPRPGAAQGKAVGTASAGAGGSGLGLAATPARRLAGLLCRSAGEGPLLLLPCRDVHTAGMRRAIDVAFVDQAGTVLEAHRNVGALRRLRNRKAAAVIERYATCTAPWFAPGDRVGLVPLPPARKNRMGSHAERSTR